VRRARSAEQAQRARRMLAAWLRAVRDGVRRARPVAALASVGRAAPGRQALGMRTLGLGVRLPGDKRDAEIRGNEDPPIAIESKGQLDNLHSLAALLADTSPQVDPKEPWLANSTAPDATGKYPPLSLVQMETLGQSSYRVVVTVHDREDKQVALSGSHASPVDELCKVFAELALRGPDTAVDKPPPELAARLAGLVPRGGSLVICSSSEASEPIYSLHLGGLAHALAASDARLITLSARGSDSGKVTAAAQRTQYNNLSNVTAIRFIPLLGGRCEARCLVHDGKHHLASLSEARDPSLFGNCSEQALRSAEREHGLSCELLDKVRRNMQFGSAANGLREKVDDLAKDIKQLTASYPELLTIFDGVATDETIATFKTRMAGNSKLWPKGMGVNYVLVFHSHNISVSSLLESLMEHKRTINVAGLNDLIHLYEISQEAGNGDMSPSSTRASLPKSAKTRVRPCRARAQSRTCSARATHCQGPWRRSATFWNPAACRSTRVCSWRGRTPPTSRVWSAASATRSCWACC
jgi:hypothetical protein